MIKRWQDMEEVVCIEYFHVYDMDGIAYSQECGSGDLVRLAEEMLTRGSNEERKLDVELVKENGGIIDVSVAIEIIEGRGYVVSIRELNFFKKDIEKFLIKS